MKNMRAFLLAALILLSVIFTAACTDKPAETTGQSGDTTLDNTDRIEIPSIGTDPVTPPEDSETDPATTDKPETEPPHTTAPDSSSKPDTETVPPETEPKTDPYIDIGFDPEAPYAFIADANTKEILYVKGNPTQKMYPASTTKLLTILYALSVVEDTGIKFTASDELELVASDSSIAYIKTGHTLTLEMLIEGMMLPSGNDAAYVVAAGVGRILANDNSLSGQAAVKIFISGMNEYGKKLGLVNTHFTCPDGYPDDNHYTCVRDMAVIAMLAADNKTIVKYGKTVSDSVRYASGETNTWKNTNSLINPESPYYYEYATGLKTGTTEASGACLVALAEKDGRRVVSGIFGAETSGARFIYSRKLLKAGLGD